MELLQLRYFLEVARTQHITRSAERLRYSGILAASRASRLSLGSYPSAPPVRFCNRA